MLTDCLPSHQQEAHQAWSSGQAQVLVGTIAFGMGGWAVAGAAAGLMLLLEALLVAKQLIEGVLCILQH